MSASLHKPVMIDDVLAALKPRDNEVYLDATFGAGGYSRAILESAECRVYAIDRDPNAVMLADALARDFPGRFLLLAGNFGDMLTLMADEGVTRVDGVVMDIGVSSMQIDEAERGFSFKKDGPLDMRMSQAGVSAEILVNELPEKELADVIYEFGEERASRAIAKAIVEEREQNRIETTGHLADVVRRVVRSRGDIDPATRTFQALRIKVNDELGELQRALEASPHLITPGGRLIVVTFHSLEDRIVKRFLRPPSHASSRHDMASLVAHEKEAGRTPFDLPFKKAVTASQEESRTNTRARSAKMRVAIRNDAPTEKLEELVY